MSTELMISMLKQANTGTEMLSVLDVLVDDDAEYTVDNVEYIDPETNQNVPTLEEIAF